MQVERDFSIVIASPSVFRNAIEIVSNTLVCATFYVEKDENKGHVYLRVDSMDPSSVSAVKLRMQLTGTVVAPTSFTVKLKMMLALLKSSPQHEALELYREKDADTVFLRSVGLDQETFELKTLDETYEPVAISDIQGTFYSIEFDTPRIKTIARLAQTIRAETLRIRVHAPANGTGGFIILKIDASGDEANATWTYQSSQDFSASERYQLCMSSDDKLDDKLIEIYDRSFSVAYISSFVKAMDRSTIVMTLGGNSPLIIEYFLGLEESDIRFLLAPKAG